MSLGRKQLEPAYVIHRRNYSDTSLIVELITPAHGRVSVLARGVKRGKAQKSLLLQPFRSLHVSWTGRGELPVLGVAEEAGNTLHLQGEALACACYINELIYHLVPKFEPAQSLFTHYWPTVSACNELELRDRQLRYFEIALLEQLGLAPTLTHDIVTGEPIDAESRYRYRIPEGPMPAELASGNGVELHGSTLLDIASMNFSSAQTLSESKKLTRALLHYHLDGKQLLSRDLYKSFHALSTQSNE